MTEGGPGLMAVRAKFGDAVEQRIRNWPHIAEELARSWTDDPETIQVVVDEARRALKRAITDPDWALDQAQMIRRAGIADDPIPSAGLLRKAQEEADAKGRENLRAWARDRDKRREKSGEPTTEMGRHQARARQILEQSPPMAEPEEADE